MSDLIKRAERFARERHAVQFRKGAAQEPYTVHLKEVANLTERWGGGENDLAAEGGRKKTTMPLPPARRPPSIFTPKPRPPFQGGGGGRRDAVPAL